MELVTAEGFVSRLTGFAGRHPVPDRVLLIPRCRSVHTFGMRFELDLVWLAGGRPVHVDRSVPPCRLRSCWAADAVVEAVAGQGDAAAELLRK